jgi:3-hydroxybutyryl-CoA dehydrogenase
MLSETILVVGAGTMGANIALDFARHGHAVRLMDLNPDQLTTARKTITTNARLLTERGLLDPTVSRHEDITTGEDLAALAAGASLVIEAVSENLPLKQKVFASLEESTSPETILASNTSTFMPSLLAEGRTHPERLLVLHYWNPAHLVPLVEIVPHGTTAPVVVERCRSLLAASGKKPVVLEREVEGFIGNRLAFAVQREAMDLVARGIATPEAIDTVVKTGFGRRMPVSGVFGTADLGGLDVYQAVCHSLFNNLCDQKAVPEALADKVAAGHLGLKSGQGWHHYNETSAEALRTAVAEELIRQAQQDQSTDT